MSEQKYDIAIIGSGIGGLATGYILSKAGFKVVILEKHSQIGGCLQTFTRDGHTFDTGIHYLGGLDKGQTLYRLFKYFGLMDKIPLLRLEEDQFDIVSYKDKEYGMAMGREGFTDKLSGYFPSESKNIRSYANDLWDTCNQLPMFNLEPAPIDESLLYQFISNNAWEKITRFTSNSDLQQVLSGLNLLHCGRKDEISVYEHSVINKHYIESSYRIIGGTHQVAFHMARAIVQQGGKILPRHEVEKLHVTNNRLIGKIDIKDKEPIFADNVISTLHPFNTLALVGEEHFRKSYWSRIHDMTNTPGPFSVYFIMKQGAMPFFNHNYYHFSGDDVYIASNLDKKDYVMDWVLFPHASKPGQTHLKTMSALTMTTYTLWKKWENTSIGQRGTNYEALKHQIAEEMIESIHRQIPGFKQSIEKYYTASPLTHRDYTGSFEGAIYGTTKNSQKPLTSILFPQTKIPNLYLSGQNLNLHGMLGVFINAFVTCGLFTDLKDLLKQVNAFTND